MLYVVSWIEKLTMLFLAFPSYLSNLFTSPLTMGAGFHLVEMKKKGFWTVTGFVQKL